MKKILISGANGFIAQNFMRSYADKYEFIHLSHATNSQLSLSDLTGNIKLIKSIDIILNLAGANIAEKRWTESRKQEILESRLLTTDNLIRLFNEHNPQAHFISASAIGIYPNDISCDENTYIDFEKHTNFSQEITKKWEQAAQNYTGKLTITRFGVVLSGNGGAFPKMLRPFQLGMGGKLGSGKQLFTWIALPDLLTALIHVIDNTKTGIYNLTAPQIISNNTLANEISQVWHKPNLLPLPEFMIKLIFGQMGNELFFIFFSVSPLNLQNENFSFSYPDITSCLMAIKNQCF